MAPRFSELKSCSRSMLAALGVPAGPPAQPGVASNVPDGFSRPPGTAAPEPPSPALGSPGSSPCPDDVVLLHDVRGGLSFDRNSETPPGWLDT